MEQASGSSTTSSLAGLTLGLTVVGVLLLLSLLPGAAHAQLLYVNEVQGSNDSTIADDDGDYPDWIEIYNAEAFAVDLAGYYLSDDAGNPTKWSFPSVSIPAGGFLVIWASDKDRVTGSFIHTNFKIKSSGEEVLISTPAAILIHLFPATSMLEDESVGAKPDGAGPYYLFIEPTPGAANTTEGYLEKLDPPGFSQAGGFRDDPIVLSLTSADPGAAIHYTLDGSEPTEASPVYSTGLLIESRVGDPNVISEIPTNELVDSAFTWVPPQGEVFKATVVRARTFKQDALESPIVTHTYFIGQDVDLRYDIAVISLVTEADNFFDDDIGLYVKGNGQANYVQDFERPIHMEFFEPGGTLGFSLDGGVKVHGQASQSYPLKTLRFYARDEYGVDEVDYPIFPGHDVQVFKRFLMRNSGQGYTNSYMPCAAAQSVVQGLELDTQAYRPAVVFLNGEYWGIHNLRERFDDHYVKNRWGVDTDDVVMLNWNTQVKEGEPGDEQHYIDLVAFVSGNDMADPANYSYVQTQMDVENYALYVIAEVFTSNTDWSQNGNNVRQWRKRTPVYQPGAPAGHDGRWRWMLFDLDRALRDTERNALENPASLHPLFDGLRVNADFQRMFVSRYADLLNTRFDPAETVPQIDAMEAAIEPYMSEHIERYSKPNTFNAWQIQVNVNRQFLQARPEFARDNLESFFGLSGRSNLTVDVAGSGSGSVSVNSLSLAAEPLPWQGVYFHEIPVALSAESAPGSVLDHWEGVLCGVGETVEVTILADHTVRAHFRLDDGSGHEWTIEEIFSNESGTIQFIELSTTLPLQDLLTGQVLANDDGCITFDTDLPDTATASRRVLIATASFAVAFNAPTPDFTMPAGFLSIDGGTLKLGELPDFVYGPLPIDGVTSLDAAGMPFLNSPTNFAGQFGSIDADRELPALAPAGVGFLIAALCAIGATRLRPRRSV